jgi:hypothetical protein
LSSCAHGVGQSFGGKGSHVSENRDIWPVLSQDGSAIRFDLAEGDGAHSGAFEAEGEAADAGKEVEDIHLPATPFDAAIHRLHG